METNVAESASNDVKVPVVTAEQTVPVSESKRVKDETNLIQENLSNIVVDASSKVAKKENNKQEKKLTETNEAKNEIEIDEQVDMTGVYSKLLILTSYW